MIHQPLIALKNVSVYRDKILVLSNLSFQMQEGEFVYLIGKTGSGKSTLLKTLYAELLIEDGEASIAGYNLTRIKHKEIPFLRRKLGIVFQDFQLLFDRTVNENLAFVMKATGWKGKEKIEKRAGEVLELVGMPVKGFKMPHELSGGEQQRVCIARALVNQPKIILADEPTGNLDPETSSEIISLLHQINLTGTTVLVATHNHQMIEKFPARVVQMERGSVVSR
jgi:cell division transport system ATP-binding protein